MLRNPNCERKSLGLQRIWGAGPRTKEASLGRTALLPDHPAEGKIALTLEFKWQISMLCTVISQAGAVASKECSRAEI